MSSALSEVKEVETFATVVAYVCGRYSAGRRPSIAAEMDALELSLSVMDITSIQALQVSSIAVEKPTFPMRSPSQVFFF